MKSNRLLFILLGIFCFSFVAVGQTQVSGLVLDAGNNNTPMIGVVVQEKDSDKGTVTDLDGRFTIMTSSIDPVLIFRYTGYTPVEVIVGGRTELEVKLAEESQLINQVVVVGYGIQKKSDLTGSVSSVDGEEIARASTANVEQALQGKVSGVYVAPNSGSPGAGAVIRIRGTGTLNNASPLYVIDGMITYDASLISADDVESIEVLKDASAAAIYGSRGANGVIIITTKSGVIRDRSIIRASGYYGVQEITKKVELLNAAEFASAYNDLRGTTYFPDPASLGEGTDWQDEIFQMAPIYNATVSANGGSEQFNYLFSANYFSQDGIVKNSHFDRLSLRLNAEYKINPVLSIGHNLAHMNIRDQIVPGVITSAYNMPPVYAARDSTGDFTDPTFFGSSIANPAADLFYKSNNKNVGSRLFGNVYADIHLFKNFTFRSNLGIDRWSRKSKKFEPIFEVSNTQRNKNDRVSAGLDSGNDWIWEQTLTYDKTWDEHHLTVLGGYTAEERKFERLGGSRENFPGTAEELLYLSAGNDTTQMNYQEASDEALTSVLFRVNYSLLSKYLFTVTWRTDRSSRFTQPNRTGHFPSGSIGWNAGAEPFLSDVSWLDQLKLRASYGILGNQNASSNYPSSGVVESGLYGIFGNEENLNQGATLTSLSNTNLQWETSRQADIGVEIGLFEGRFDLEVDWYDRLTYDIIADVPIPDYVGSQADPVVNTARVDNRGWDIAANWRQSGEVSYNFGVIFSPVKNKIIKLADGKSEILSADLQGEFATRSIPGLPIGAFYGYKVGGVFQTQEELDASPKFGTEKPGDIRYVDTNGDGKLDDDDRVYLGSPIPTLTYSMSAGLDWNGIDLNADIIGASGHHVFNAKETFRFGVFNWEQHVADRWTTTNPSLTEPRITNGGHNYIVSDRFLQDGSFLRLRNITLGYSIPERLMEKAGMSKMRVYVSGTNVWTQQKYTGYSPEFPNANNAYQVGFDFGSYPVSKSWVGGIEIQF